MDLSRFVAPGKPGMIRDILYPGVPRSDLSVYEILRYAIGELGNSRETWRRLIISDKMNRLENVEMKDRLRYICDKDSRKHYINWTEIYLILKDTGDKHSLFKDYGQFVNKNKVYIDYDIIGPSIVDAMRKNPVLYAVMIENMKKGGLIPR